MEPQLLDNADRGWRLDGVFGRSTDAIALVEESVPRELPGQLTVVREGDTATFKFSYVAEAAVELMVLLPPPVGFGATAGRTGGPPEDHSDAVAFCAIAAGQGCSRHFVYRAAAAARLVHFAARRRRLREIMIDETATRSPGADVPVALT